jgi:antitoxin YefM
MASLDIQYISDEHGKTKAVVVPIALWREIEAEREAARLLKLDAAKLGLVVAEKVGT